MGCKLKYIKEEECVSYFVGKIYVDIRSLFGPTYVRISYLSEGSLVGGGEIEGAALGRLEGDAVGLRVGDAVGHVSSQTHLSLLNVASPGRGPTFR